MMADDTQKFLLTGIDFAGEQDTTKLVLDLLPRLISPMVEQKFRLQVPPHGIVCILNPCQDSEVNL